MQSISPLVISDENFDQIIGDNSLVIVDFWAEWCGPCRAMNPIIEELSLIYENKLVFAKLNVAKETITKVKNILSRFIIVFSIYIIKIQFVFQD